VFKAARLWGDLSKFLSWFLFLNEFKKQTQQEA
jgi:hypothetical protein